MDGDEVVEAERLRQKVAREAASRFERGIRQLGESIDVRLANAERSRNFFADGQALADSVIRLRLLGRLPAIDAGNHRGRDEVAFERD
jgi:hypothetical protein